MSLRHAAALALAGWYLMVPPILQEDDSVRINPEAPIGQWSVLKSFDSAEACNEIKQTLERSNRNLEPAETNDQLKKDSALNTKCIATDDPRLKGATP